MGTREELLRSVAPGPLGPAPQSVDRAAVQRYLEGRDRKVLNALGQNNDIRRMAVDIADLGSELDPGDVDKLERAADSEMFQADSREDTFDAQEEQSAGGQTSAIHSHPNDFQNLMEKYLMSGIRGRAALVDEALKAGKRAASGGAVAQSLPGRVTSVADAITDPMQPGLGKVLEQHASELPDYVPDQSFLGRVKQSFAGPDGPASILSQTIGPMAKSLKESSQPYADYWTEVWNNLSSSDTQGPNSGMALAGKAIAAVPAFAAIIPNTLATWAEQAAKDVGDKENLKSLAGIPITPKMARVGGDLIDLVSDPLPGTVARLAKPVTKTAKVIAKPVQKVVDAGNRALDVHAPSIAAARDAIGTEFGGRGYQIGSAARAAGVPEDVAKKATDSLYNLPVAQGAALQDLEAKVPFLKSVPEHWHEAVSEAIEKPNMIGPAELPPVAQHAKELYTKEANMQGAELGLRTGLPLRENYFAHPGTPKVNENIAKYDRGITPEQANLEQQVFGSGDSYTKERKLPEQISNATGKPVVSAVDVNDAFQDQLAGRVNVPQLDLLAKKSGLKPGEKFVNTNLPQNFVERFAPGRLAIEEAKAAETLGVFGKNLTPGAPMPAGYVQPQPTSMLYKVHGPNKVFPRKVVDAWESTVSPTTSAKMENVPLLGHGLKAWKRSVTTATPGYAVRNDLSMKGVLLDQQGLDFPVHAKTANDIWDNKIGQVAGIPYDTIRDRVRSSIGLYGTSGGPGKFESAMRFESGLKNEVAHGPRQAFRDWESGANLADEKNRLQAVVGRLATNGGNLDEAIDWSLGMMPALNRAPPVLDKASVAMPFVRWPVMYGPAYAKQMLKGKGSLPFRMQQLNETLTGPENQVTDSMQENRQRQQNQLWLGMKDENGRTLAAPNMLSMMPTVIQTMDPLYQLAEHGLGEEGRAKAFGSVMEGQRQMLGPAIGIMGSELTQKQGFTGADIQTLQKPTPWQEAAARVYRPLAEEMGVQYGMDENGNEIRLSTAEDKQLPTMLPYSWLPRMFTSDNETDAIRAAMSGAGFTTTAVDPANRLSRDTSEQRNRLQLRLDALQKLNGLK